MELVWVLQKCEDDGMLLMVVVSSVGSSKRGGGGGGVGIISVGDSKCTFQL